MKRLRGRKSQTCLRKLAISKYVCKPDHVSDSQIQVQIQILYSPSFTTRKCLESGKRITFDHIYIYIYGTGVAQFVERPTEKPGAILTRARVPGAARDFSPRVSFQCSLLRCLYSPRVQLHVSTSVCMLKNPKHWQTYLYFDTCKYCAHS